MEFMRMCSGHRALRTDETLRNPVQRLPPKAKTLATVGIDGKSSGDDCSRTQVIES